MTTLLFQLVRVRRSSASPSSATTFAAISSSAPSWSLEVPETVRAVVENFADPVEVVSYVGCNRSTQDALWAAAVAEHSNYHHRTSNDDTIVSGRIGGPAVPPEFNGPNQGGIWAWLSPRKSSYNTGGSKIGTGTGTGTTETTSEFNPVVNTLYLINRDDELLKDAEEFQLEYRPYTLDNVLVPLLALCSTRMNIVSITTRDTKADLSHLGRSLSVLTTKPQQQQQQQQQQQCVSSSELADLSWHWCGSTSDFTYDPLSSTNNSHDYTDSGISTLKQIIAKLEKTAGNEVSEHLSVLQKCFKDVQCHLPSSASQGTSNNDNNNDNNGNQLDYPAQEDQQQDIDYILTHELKDLSITEANTSSIFDENLWFRKLLDSDGDTNQDMFLNPRLINGPMLFIRLQACLQQLNTQPTLFYSLDMRRSINSLTQDRAFHYGVHAYHRVMNEHLDRQAIPLPWHTLAMFHYDAQSKALEEIEKRYSYVGALLPKLLREFRKHCLEPRIQGVTTTTDSITSATSTPDTASALEAIIPTGGLYLEYYSANASALQNHHLLTLDENWQMYLKSRLASSPSSSNAMALSSTTQSALAHSRTLSIIKDYTDFLLAVDQVRRGYLETCIPSPEAISVLENLDEMQQNESVIFLKSVAENSALATTRRCSVSSSGHQSIMVSGGSSSDLLTDTLSGKRTSIQALANASGGTGSSSALGGKRRSIGGDSAVAGIIAARAQLDPSMTELDQQIAEIMLAKRRPKPEDLGRIQEVLNEEDTHHNSNKEDYIDTIVRSRSDSSSSRTGALSTTGGFASNPIKESDTKSVVQFGWTLHMLHANTLQYAWIWTWLYMHEGSSRQNVVACDSKMYTASKWIILPAKDLVRTRKDWKVSYGDRVWLVSYWFSTRNAKMDLPEYLPKARGSSCRHVIPYGETYVICKTCPADILCMRCFRASDHTDHTMYLQCSWGTSVCVCGDPQRLKVNNALHCSLHCAENERSYSGLAKGKPCQIKFKTGEKVYRCKSCAIGKNESAVLCDRCFRSHNHFGHDVIARIAETGLVCSCCDGESWRPDLQCTYHSPGLIGTEYLPRTITTAPSALSPWIPLPTVEKQDSMLTKLSHTHDDTDSVGSHSHNSPSAEAEAEEAVSVTPHRCGHVFQPGEDIYHCRDCSFNDMVVLCSRCFHNSGCVNHRWRMGEFKNPVRESQRSKALKRKERRRQKAAGKSVYKEEEEEQGEKREKQVGHDGELSASGLVDSLDIAEENPSHDASSQKSSLPKSPPAEMNEIDNNDDGGSSDDDDDDDEEIEEEDNDLEQQESEEPVYRISCDCGDPEMFKTAFDCNYHLPQEFRPVPSLIHCNYLFQRNETMFRCRTCHIVDEGNDDNSPAFDSMDETPLSDIWICARCFDPEDHSDHDVEEMLNVRNEGLYCHCGDPTIQRPNLSNAAAGSTTAASTGASLDCRDDHNRQNVLCTTEIKEGMFYYSCKSCQTDSSRLFCEPCFVKEAHEDHSYRRLYASTGFPVTTCGCGENSAFRFATNCQQHERAGGTNIVHRCRYHASAGEWVAFCSDCYPTQEGLVSPYLCLRCRQGSDHTGHNVKWIKLEQDMLYPCACGSHSLSRLAPDNTTITETMTISAFIDLSSNVSTTVIMESDPLESSSAAANSGSKSPVLAARRNSKRSSINSSLSAITSRPTSNLSVASSQSSSSPQLVDKSAGSTAATDTTSSASASAAAASAAASAAAAAEDEGKTIPPALCQYHTMIYKTTPSTTLFLHSHNYRSINHQDHNEVTGYKYHDSNNDWIVRRPGEGEGEVRVAREGGRGRGREDNIPNISISNTNTTTSTNNNTKQIQHLSPYLQWKDVYWLQHANTGKYFNSMASLKISQGFQEVSALESPHSNNDWIIEETTWLRQQILSDE